MGIWKREPALCVSPYLNSFVENKLQWSFFPWLDDKSVGEVMRDDIFTHTRQHCRSLDLASWRERRERTDRLLEVEEMFRTPLFSPLSFLFFFLFLLERKRSLERTVPGENGAEKNSRAIIICKFCSCSCFSLF
jgi:hypothetical protein